MNVPPELRKPCPECGSTARLYSLSRGSTIVVRGMRKFKAFHGAETKPFLLGKVGDDLFRKTGLWNRIERWFDRAHDWYEECIVYRDTGHSMSKGEPLSQHRGYGSAKRK